MSRVLLAKLLRDLRWPLLLVGLLLLIYQVLWAKVTDQITGELVPSFTQYMPLEVVRAIFFQGPVKIIEAIIGGEMISLEKPQDMLTIGYVHPVIQTIFCIWAIGRAASALAGEVDRGSMDLLLAQPIARWQVVTTHLAVDAVTIPVLCISLFSGTWIGTRLVGLGDVDLTPFLPPLAAAAALMFAVSGYSIALSAVGRFRSRVISLALGITLAQFVVNLMGQLWDGLSPWRMFTVFYYYQPQQIILRGRWTVPVLQNPVTGVYLAEVHVLAVLVTVGVLGYLYALFTFCRRDLPAAI